MCVYVGWRREKLLTQLYLWCWELYHMYFLVWRAGTYPGNYEARLKPQFHQLVAV